MQPLDGYGDHNIFITWTDLTTNVLEDASVAYSVHMTLYASHSDFDLELIHFSECIPISYDSLIRCK